MVLSDGKSADDVRGPSNALKGMGVRIYCVGAGRYIHSSQLDIMSSPPKRTHIFVADWPHLGVLVNGLKDAICLGEKSKQSNALFSLMLLRVTLFEPCSQCQLLPHVLIT